MSRPKAIIYARVSSLPQSRADGLDRQIRNGLRRAQVIGADVVAVYGETCSGDRDTAPPVLMQAVKRIIAREAGILVVESPDRLARRRVVVAAVLEAVEAAGGRVEWTLEAMRAFEARMLCHALAARASNLTTKE